MPITREEAEKLPPHKNGWKEIEDSVREALSKKFNTTLSERKLIIGTKKDGNPSFHRFDMVSDNGKITGEIKSHGLGKNNSTNTAKCFEACHYLGLIEAKKKLLVLTDKKFFEEFQKRSNGKLGNIELILCEVRI